MQVRMRRSFALKIVVIVLALTGSSLWAQDGLAGALSRATDGPPTILQSPFAQTLAAADFDGDNKPDGAILLDPNWLRPQNSFRTIELHFTGHKDTDLTFQSTEADLTISALDVNGDGTIDIVVEQSFTHKRLHVWLNDGRGRFRKVRAESFPSTEERSQERLESPAQQPDCPAFCLPSQRGPEVASLAAGPLLYLPCLFTAQALGSRPPIGAGAVAPNSQRAPPLIRSL